MQQGEMEKDRDDVEIIFTRKLCSGSFQLQGAINMQMKLLLCKAVEVCSKDCAANTSPGICWRLVWCRLTIHLFGNTLSAISLLLLVIASVIRPVPDVGSRSPCSKGFSGLVGSWTASFCSRCIAWRGWCVWRVWFPGSKWLLDFQVVVFALAVVHQQCVCVLDLGHTRTTDTDWLAWHSPSMNTNFISWTQDSWKSAMK